MKLILIMSLVFFFTALSNAAPSLTDNKHSQLVIVITHDWNSNSGILYTFNKDDKTWIENNMSFPVTIGKKGLAWGIGLHPKQTGTEKIEGDGKAPAGIFELGSAFGYLSALNTKLGYRPMTQNDYCIDITDSQYYNQLVDKQVVGSEAVAGSTEAMRRDIYYKDDLYKKGLFIKHNTKNDKGKGSCIFMHMWRDQHSPTAGCTAMSEDNIDKLLSWLDIKANPLYLVLPKEEYDLKKLAWGIPELFK